MVSQNLKLFPNVHELIIYPETLLRLHPLRSCLAMIGSIPVQVADETTAFSENSIKEAQREAFVKDRDFVPWVHCRYPSFKRDL